MLVWAELGAKLGVCKHSGIVDVVVENLTFVWIKASRDSLAVDRSERPGLNSSNSLNLCVRETQRLRLRA